MLVNLMPHSFRILNASTGIVDEYPGAAAPARVSVRSIPAAPKCGSYPVFIDNFGEIEGLPDPQEGVVFVVSLLVKARAQLLGRIDVVSPSSGPTAVKFTDGPRKGQIDYVVSLSA
jgi:hypothetical protein